MKNFYKIFKGITPGTGTGNKNIASAPEDSYGTIIGSDGTKIDFFGNHSIESSQTNPLIRNKDIFASSGNISYNYFPMDGFKGSTSLEDSIFEFSSKSIPESIGNRKNIKFISTNTKIKNLKLTTSLSTLTVSGNLVAEGNTEIGVLNVINGSQFIDDDIITGNNGIVINQDSAQIEGTSKISGNLEVTETSVFGKKVTIKQNGAQITGNSKVTGTFQTTDLTTANSGITVVSNGMNVGTSAVNVESTIIGKVTVENSTTFEDLTVESAGISTTTGSSTVLSEKTSIGTGLIIKDGAQIAGNSKVTGTFQTTSDTTIGGELNVTGDLEVTDKTKIDSNSNLEVIGDITTGSLTTGSSVSDNTFSANNLTMNAATSMSSSGIDIEITGLTSTLNLATNDSKITNLGGKTTFNGYSESCSLSVDGSSTLNTLSMTSTIDDGTVLGAESSTTNAEGITFEDVADDGLTPEVAILDNASMDDTVTTHMLRVDGKDTETDFHLNIVDSDNSVNVEFTGDEGSLEVGSLLEAESVKNNGTLEAGSEGKTITFGNNLKISKNGSIVSGDSTLGDSTLKNNVTAKGTLRVKDTSTLSNNVDIKNVEDAGGLDVTESTSLNSTSTFKSTLQVTTGITEIKKKTTIVSGGLDVTGGATVTLGGLTTGSFETSDDVVVTGANHSSFTSISKYNNVYPGVTSGSETSNTSLTLKDTLETTTGSGTSKLSGDINITGNLDVSGKVEINTNEITVAEPTTPTITKLSVVESAPTAGTASVNITAGTPISTTGSLESGYDTSGNGSWTSGSISIGNSVSKTFTTVNVNTTFNPTNLIENDSNSIISGSVLNSPADTSTEYITVTNLELDNWTDNTNFIPDKSSYSFKDNNDSNASNLAWSSESGYQLYAKVLDETSSSSVNEYISFAKKGTAGYEFIEDGTSGCKIDMSTTTTKIYLGGEFIESEGSSTQTADPAVYIRTFVPEISYSTSTGFTVTNFSTLLEETGTTSDDWSVGVLMYHKTFNYGYESSTSSSPRRRHFRTTWDYWDIPLSDNGPEPNQGNEYPYMHPDVQNGTAIKISNNGAVSGTNKLHKKGVNGKDARLGQLYSFIGIRLRYLGSGDPRNGTAPRSKYPAIMYGMSGSSASIITKNTNELMSIRP